MMNSKKSIRFAVLILLLAFSSFGIIRAEDTNHSATPSQTGNPNRKELVAERSLTRKVFQNADGTRTGFYYAAPVHYQDEDGNWQELNLKPVTVGMLNPKRVKHFGVADKFRLFAARHKQMDMQVDGQGVVEPQPDDFSAGVVDNNFGVFFPKKLKKPISFSFTASSQIFILPLDMDVKNIKLRLDGNEFVYENIWTEAALRYRVMAKGLKEEIILNNTTAPNTYRFFLALRGCTATQNPDGTIGIYANNSLIGALEKPWASDAKDENSPEMTMGLKQVNGGYEVSIAVDATWLKDQNRAFPVKIDPTVSIYHTTKDTHLNEQHPDSSYGSSDTLSLGNWFQWFVGYHPNRILIWFDVNPVPLYAPNSAKLHLHCQETKTYGEPDNTAEIYPMTAGWSESSTWNSAASSYNSSQLMSSVNLNNFGASGWHEFALNATGVNVVKSWASSDTNNKGMMVKITSEDDGPIRFYDSSEATTTSYVPYFEVEYVELYSNVIATPAEGSVTISWNTNVPTTNNKVRLFNAEFAPDGYKDFPVAEASNNSYSIKITGLHSGSHYNYQVYGDWYGTTGDYSPLNSFIVPDTTPPNFPKSNVTISLTRDANNNPLLNLEWLKATDPPANDGSAGMGMAKYTFQYRVFNDTSSTLSAVNTVDDDGRVNYTQLPIPIVTDTSHKVEVIIKAMDAAIPANVTMVTTDPIVIAPVKSAISGLNLNDNQLTITASSVDCTGYQFSWQEIDPNTHDYGAFTDSAWQTGTTYTFTLPAVIPHNTYQCAVKTRNIANDMSGKSYYTYSAPNHAPTVTWNAEPLDGAFFKNNNITILRPTSLSDADGDTIYYRVQITNTSTTETQTTDWQTGGDISLTSLINTNGIQKAEYTWKIQVDDHYMGAGSYVQSESRSFTIDTVAPGIPNFSLPETVYRDAVTGDYELAKCSSGTSIPITLTGLPDFSTLDATSGVVAVNVRNDHDSWTPITLPLLNTYIPWSVPNVVGSYNVQMVCVDRAGNVDETNGVYTLTVEVIGNPNKPEPVSQSKVDELNAVTLFWSGIKGYSYDVCYRIGDGPLTTYSTVQATVNGHISCRIEGLNPNTSITAEIFAINQLNLKSADFLSIAACTLAPAFNLTAGALTNNASCHNTTDGIYVMVAKPNNPGGYTLKISLNDAENPVSFDVSSVKLANLTSHSTNTLQLISYNQIGEANYGAKLTFTVANQKPGPPLPGAPANSGFISTSTPTLQFDVNHPGSDADQDDTLAYKYTLYYIDASGTHNILNDSSSGEVTTPLNDGKSYFWYIKAVDDGGAPSEPSAVYSFTVDLSAPVITIPGQSSAWATSRQVTINAVDIVSGVARIQYCWNSGTWQDYTPGSSFTAPVGVNYLTVRAFDGAGNVTGNENGAYTYTFRVDSTPPTIDPISLPLPKDTLNRYCAISNIIIINNLTLKDPQSGLANLRWQFSASQEAQLASPNLLTLNGNFATLTPTFTRDFQNGETFYLLLQAVDTLGNGSAVTVLGPIIRDTTAPQLGNAQLTGSTDSGYIHYYEKWSDFSVNWAATDPETGIQTTQYAIVQEGQSVNQVSSWVPDRNTLGNGLINGQKYDFLMKVTNYAGLSAIGTVGPLVFDATAPVVTALQNAGVTQTRVAISVTATEPESGINGYLVALGSAAGGTNLSDGLPGADQGWLFFASTAVNQELVINQLELSPGTIYASVKAKNLLGQTGAALTIPLIIIDPAAQPVVSDDGEYWADPDRLHFSWLYNGTPVSFNYRLYKDDAPITGWLTTYDQDIYLAGPFSHGSIYKLHVKALKSTVPDEFTPEGVSNGITIDTEKPEVNSVTIPAYTAGNNISVTWSAVDTVSHITEASVALGDIPYSTELTGGYVTLPSGGGLLSRDTVGNALQLEHNTICYLTLRLRDSAGNTTIYLAGSLKVDTTAPPLPSIQIPGRYIKAESEQRLSANWHWQTDDPESGISFYEYALLEEVPVTDADTVWSEPTTETSHIFTDSPPAHGKTYYVAVMAVNGAGLVSQKISGPITGDRTSPTIPTVNDGLDYLTQNLDISINLTCTDLESGLKYYTYGFWDKNNQQGIAQAADMGDYTAFTSQAEQLADGVSSFTREVSGLTQGKLYYFGARAKNGVDLWSGLGWSDGFMYDSALPAVNNLALSGVYITAKGQVAATWEAAATNSGIAYYEVALGQDRSVIPGPGSWTQVNNKTYSWPGSDLPNGAYYCFARAVSRAGLTGPVSISENSVTIDTSIPTVSFSKDGGYSGLEIPLKWTATIGPSGIKRFEYALGAEPGKDELTGGRRMIYTNSLTVNEIYNISRNLVSDGEQVYLTVWAWNNAQESSLPAISKPFVLDLNEQAPTVTVDHPYQNSATIISGVSWSINSMPSGVSHYRASIVPDRNTVPDGEAIVTNVTEQNLNPFTGNFSNGAQVLIGVQAQNGAGVWSPTGYVAVTVDLVAPDFNFTDTDNVFLPAEMPVSLGYSLNEPAALNISWKVESTGASGPIPTINGAGGTGSIPFTRDIPATYTVTVTAIDLAGNTIIKNHSFRINALPVLEVVNPTMNVHIQKGGTLNLKANIYDDCNELPQTAHWTIWSVGESGSETLYKTLIGTISRANTFITESAITITDFGAYHLKLRILDADNGNTGDVFLRTITVGPTVEGSLIMNEEWNSEVELTGMVTVPQGKTLTIRSGVKIRSRENAGMKILGSLNIENGATLTVVTGYTKWQGLYLLHGSFAQITGATFSNAIRGLICDRINLEISDCSFTNNEIGLNILGGNTIIQKCSFNNNSKYGIKEDYGVDGSPPVVQLSGCSFAQNTVGDYYDVIETVMSVNEL